jgi:hypothetical protein
VKVRKHLTTSGITFTLFVMMGVAALYCTALYCTALHQMIVAPAEASRGVRRLWMSALRILDSTGMRGCTYATWMLSEILASSCNRTKYEGIRVCQGRPKCEAPHMCKDCPSLSLLDLLIAKLSSPPSYPPSNSPPGSSTAPLLL